MRVQEHTENTERSWSGPGRRLQVGVSLPTWEDRHGRVPAWGEIQDLAHRAEGAGIDTLWVPDHLQSRPTTGFWEAWTILAALAQVTERIVLGPHVLSTAYRHPGLVARMAATLDEIAPGRLVLGLGSGDPDFDASFRLYGYPTDHPVSRFAEALEIIVRLFREDTLDFQGRYYQINGGALRPSGRREARPPIWVAAKGPRMLELAARWADAVNYEVPGTRPQDLVEVFRHLDQACQDVGRDPATLARTTYALISFAPPERTTSELRTQALRGTPEDIALQLHAFHAVGVEHLTCWIDDGDAEDLQTVWPRLTTQGLEQFVPVIEALRELEARAPM